MTQAAKVRRRPHSTETSGGASDASAPGSATAGRSGKALLSSMFLMGAHRIARRGAAIRPAACGPHRRFSRDAAVARGAWDNRVLLKIKVARLGRYSVAGSTFLTTSKNA